MYLLLFLVGAIGFVAMTILGVSHGIGGGHHGALGHGHTGAGHGHSGAGHAHAIGTNGGHLPAVHRANLAPTSHASPSWKLLAAVSPLDIFSMALGAGAAGELLKGILLASMLPWAAVAGAIVFNFFMVKPLMRLFLSFASEPSEGLEGTVASLGEAVTAFDSEGRGIVRLEMDGQIIQLLGHLDSVERGSGVTVSKGEKVVVLDVDTARNTCRVSRELAPSLADEAASQPVASSQRTVT